LLKQAKKDKREGHAGHEEHTEQEHKVIPSVDFLGAFLVLCGKRFFVVTIAGGSNGFAG
jgi:hypothetical protein